MKKLSSRVVLREACTRRALLSPRAASKEGVTSPQKGKMKDFEYIVPGAVNLRKLSEGGEILEHRLFCSAIPHFKVL